MSEPVSCSHNKSFYTYVRFINTMSVDKIANAFIKLFVNVINVYYSFMKKNPEHTW